MNIPACWAKTFQISALFLAWIAMPGFAASSDPALSPLKVELVGGGKYGPETRRFQGIPGVARAPGGRLWATWYGGGLDEGPENYVMLATSDTNGDTWSTVKAVIDSPDELRTFDPVIWLDPRGRLWWFYAQSYKWWDGRAGVWAVVSENPDDAVPRWSAPRRIADGVMMQKPTVLKSGDWLLPIAYWSHAPKTDVSPESPRFIPPTYVHWNPQAVGTHIYVSRDQGRSFEHLGTAKVPDVRFEEHMIIERKDGSLWLLARTNFGISESISNDGGHTWSEGKPTSIPHIPSRFFIRRLISGRLLLVKHNPRLDTAWLLGGVAKVWEQRSHLTAYLSDDDGRTWKGGLVLDERLPAAYPDGDQAPDGTLYVICDYDRHRAKEIVLARFTEDDVLAGHLVRPSSRTRILVNKATGADSK